MKYQTQKVALLYFYGALGLFLAIFLAFFRLPERWGWWYLDQWVMLLAVIATVGSAWGYISAFLHTVRSEPSRTGS